MEVNAADVKKLRDRTGMQMMKCKAALTQAGGDMEKAVELLRLENAKTARSILPPGRRPRAASASSSTRSRKSGPSSSCGTARQPPVAKNEMFVKLANDVAKQIAIKGATTVEKLLAEPFVDAPGKTVNDRIADVVGLMRENVKPAPNGPHGGDPWRVHPPRRLGRRAAAGGRRQGRPEILLRDVCMHIAAKSPMAAVREDVPKDKIEKEMEIARAQAQETGKNKPANIIEKIAEGKLRTWFEENVLAEQKFVKDETKTVAELLKGAGLKLKRFVRLRVGEVTNRASRALFFKAGSSLPLCGWAQVFKNSCPVAVTSHGSSTNVRPSNAIVLTLASPSSVNTPSSPSSERGPASLPCSCATRNVSYWQCSSGTWKLLHNSCSSFPSCLIVASP